MMSRDFKICYCITKRGDRSYWNRIGVAFVNSDGSLNVKLDSFPVNGELQIRDCVSRDETWTPTRQGPDPDWERDFHDPYSD